MKPITTRGRRPLSVALVIAFGAVTATTLVAPAVAADSVLAPSSMVTTSGSVDASQTVRNLAVQDQSGTADNYAKYVELDSTPTPYSGYRQYTVPSSVAPASVTGIVVRANYRGPAAAQQTWTWSVYNWSTSTWTTVGSNAGAASWVWKPLTFAGPGSAASHVSGTGAVRVRVSSNNAADNALLDYESITVSSAANPPAGDTSAPSVPTNLTAPSVTSSSVNLSWTGSSDNTGVTGYEVFVNGSSTASATSTGTTATVSGLSSATSYSFTVKARDAAGNRSAASAARSAVTAAQPPSSGFTLPAPNGKWDYQIGGPYTPPSGVVTVSRDRTVAPVSGLYNICYVNLMQTQPDESGQSTTNPPYGTTAWWLKNHPNVVLKNAQGQPIIDPDWDEVVFDVRTPAQRSELASVQKPWIQACKDAGYQAIEPDNIDAEVRSSGYLTHSDVRAYLQDIVVYTHSIGLAIGQKNAIGEDSPDPEKREWRLDGPTFVTTVSPAQGFDFAIAEECGQFNECDVYAAMYPGRVQVVEYKAAGYTKACNGFRTTLSVIRRNVKVTAPGTSGYVYQEC